MNLLDHFFEEYFFRPAAIVSYSGGSFGGVRAASHLRDMLAELGMASIPSQFPVPKVQAAFDDAGVPADAALIRRFNRFASELEWYAGALKLVRTAAIHLGGFSPLEYTRQPGHVRLGERRAQRVLRRSVRHDTSNIPWAREGSAPH